MVKQNKDMKKAFIQSILGHFNKKDKPDFIKNLIKNGYSDFILSLHYKADFIINGGWGDNVPSTVIDLSEGVPVLIRAGKGNPDVIG